MVAKINQIRDNQNQVLSSDELNTWFWDSKVVDENWKPLLVFHGSDMQFDQFNMNLTGSKQSRNKDPGFFGRWIYFTPHVWLAKKYGNNIYRCFLKVEKMLEFTDQHCTIRNFDPKKLPEEIREEVMSIYSPLHDEREKQYDMVDRKKVWLSGVDSWVILTPARDKYYEDILSEVIREVLIKKWYQGIKWFNPVSGVDEYMVLDVDNIRISSTEVYRYCRRSRSKK